MRVSVPLVPVQVRQEISDMRDPSAAAELRSKLIEQRVTARRTDRGEPHDVNAGLTARPGEVTAGGVREGQPGGFIQGTAL